MRTFTEIEKHILNRIQKDIKITYDPLKGLSEELGIDEQIFFKTVQQLKDEKIIRDISAIFNADRLGYRSSLIAFKITDSLVDTASGIISAHPGVSHNYLRDHNYNIWFTLAVASHEDIDNETAALAKKCGASDYLILRNEKLLKIGLMLSVDHEEKIVSDEIAPKKTDEQKQDSRPFSDEEKTAVRVLQTDLPLCERPFKKIIESNNFKIEENRVIEIGESLKGQGIMRRYSAVLRHQRAGYSSNAMTAWKIFNAEENTGVINRFQSVSNISHLYFRTLYPGRWEHPLFAMIHARDDEELNNIIKRLENETGIKDYLVLKTLKEFKKKRIKYF